MKLNEAQRLRNLVRDTQLVSGRARIQTQEVEPKTSKAWEEEEEMLLSFVWVFETPWTVAHQAPLSIGFSRQEYWSG